MSNNRKSDIDRVYAGIDLLLRQTPAGHTLDQYCQKSDFMADNPPDIGLYIFLSPTENHGATDTPRAVRIGANAENDASSIQNFRPLWKRLKEHRGCDPRKLPENVTRNPITNGRTKYPGNHRAGSFRKAIGYAIRARDGTENQYPDWGVGNVSTPENHLPENPLEAKVSKYLFTLPFVWIVSDDTPGKHSTHSWLEKHLIGLLSNYDPADRRDRTPIDPQPDDWLGHHHPPLNKNVSPVAESGLWNANEVSGVDGFSGGYDSTLIDKFEELVEETVSRYRTGQRRLPNQSPDGTSKATKLANPRAG